MSDVRLAIRALAATPIVSIAAVLSLALGIGANTALFSIVNSLLLRELPVAAPERLAAVSSDQGIALGFKAGLGWNYGMWSRLQERAQAFDGAAAWSPQRLSLGQGGETQPVEGLVTSGSFFTTLGVAAIAGRTYSAADDVRGGGPDGPVAVISHALWQRRFGGDPRAVGSTLHVEGAPLTIVGVMPPSFLGLDVGRAFDVALPLGAEPLVRGRRAAIDQPRSLFLFILLRLKPDQSFPAATAALRTMQPEILGPDVPAFVREPFTLVPAAAGADTPDSARPRYRRSVITVLAVVSLVLLVAAANIANLQLARAAARRHELSVRLALGAPRWRLARQLLVESFVLAGAGAGAGLVFAVWGSRALVARLSTAAGPVALDVALDWRVLAFTAAVTIATAILAGTAPALRAARIAPIDALKQEGRALAGGGGSSTLVVVQVALSLVLVVGAGLFIRTFQRLAAVPLGFDRDRVLVAAVDTARVKTGDRMALFHQLVAACAAAPGVSAAAGSVSTPLGVGLPRGIDVAGAAPDRNRMALVNAVTRGWFGVYGTPIRAGRDIDDRDAAAAPPVVLVNDAFARRFLAGRDPLGATVAKRTVVGVVGDQLAQGGFKPDGTVRTVRDDAAPAIYMPLAQSAGQFPPDRTAVTISLRPAAGSPAPLARTIAAALTAIDPAVAYTLRPLADSLEASLAQERLVAALSGFFGALALLLAALGLYGLTTYAVTRRRMEIGIRLALGAAPDAVVRMVLARVAVLVAIGIAAGAGASLWAARFIAPLLYGLQPGDPGTLAAAAAVLAAVGAAAGFLPARRASRIAPSEILRNA